MTSLYKIGRGRRGKKKAAAAGSGKKRVAPSALRVQTDMDELELPYNVKLIVPNPENLCEFLITIKPDSGYWKDASYTFKFIIPDNYPYKPPGVTCTNKIYHPNIDIKGNVCLNLLKNDWTAILSTQQVVHGLIFLFMEPNPADPLNIEAAKVMRDNPSQFKRNVDKSLRGGTVDGEYYESRLNK